MGGVGVGGQDLLRAWTNPATLADMDRRGELALGGSTMFAGEQSTFGFGAGWMMKPGWGIGALLSSYSLSIPEIDVNGRIIGANLERGSPPHGGGRRGEPDHGAQVPVGGGD